MDDHGLSISDYVSIVRSMKPLCLGCLDLDHSIFDWRASRLIGLYPDLDPRKIVAGADGGCVSCALIYAAFQSARLDLRTSHGVQEIILSRRSKSSSLMAIARFPNEPSIRVELYTNKGDICSPWSIINQGTHISGNTASQAGTQRMQEWIEQCFAGHETCSHSSNAPLPTRVLDLGDSSDTIRLLETHDESGPYICLSHCWGSSPTILCTSETYDAFTGNIPWNSLPPLFRDAIKVCRILKVRYLWIDKLCIIQHDKEDWAREGSRMAQIFEGSFLTIAALSSKHDKDPLFFKDEKHAPSQQIHTGLMKDGTVYTVYSRVPFDHHPDDYSHWALFDKDHPLLTRAWVYQEKLLAPRILYFGKELSWECREASACECSGMDRGMKYEHSLSLASTNPTSQVHLQWRKMVESFSCLCLSYEDDRLPAFSGLAQQFQSRLQSPYLAGLWKDSLKTDLLWHSKRAWHPEAPRYYTRKPSKWRAPTWSWASVEGPVVFLKTEGDHALIPEIEIISAECVPLSVDMLGAVSDGRLMVRGKTRPALLSHREDCKGTDTRHFSSRATGYRAYLTTNNFTVEGLGANVDYDLIDQGLMAPNSDMSIHCLYLIGAPFEQPHFDQHRGEYVTNRLCRVVFLLLRFIRDKTFERIGFLKHDSFSNRSEIEILSSLTEDVITII